MRIKEVNPKKTTDPRRPLEPLRGGREYAACISFGRTSRVRSFTELVVVVIESLVQSKSFRQWKPAHESRGLDLRGNQFRNGFELCLEMIEPIFANAVLSG